MKNENCDKRLFCDDYKYNHCDGCGANKPKGDLISREALKKAIDKEFDKANLSDYEACSCVCEIYDKCIDNAPTIAVNCKDCDGYEAGYSAGVRDTERPQGDCENCDFIKFTEKFMDGFVEGLNKYGIESVEQLSEILRKGEDNDG